MESLEFFDAYPSLRQILLGSNLLDFIPGGFSIATDCSCENIFHNPVAAKFFRIEPWGQFSRSTTEIQPVRICHNGRILRHEELPVYRAVWFGEDVVGQELEFIWDDGISKIARWSARPLHDENGIICGGIATMEDITDIIHLTRELDTINNRLKESFNKAVERFSKVFKYNPVMGSIVRLSDYRFIDVNERFLSEKNLSYDEVIGKTPVEIGVPKTYWQLLISRLKERGYIDNFEAPCVSQSGVQGTLLLSAEIIDLNGERCIIFTHVDITELKNMQVEMARLDRLSIIGEMAAGIGHEVRNPMTTVRGYLQLLGSKNALSKYNSQFALMIDELDRANSIITEFLSLAKDRVVELKMQNLKEIVEKIFPLIQADGLVSDKYIHMELEEVPEIPLDKKEINQLILNLVLNASQAMAQGGTMYIKTYMDKEEIVLSVQNDGEEITSEVLGKIGTPFFTTKENGTGLGLAVCYSIVARHNAKIDIETDSTRTIFFVRFKR